MHEAANKELFFVSGDALIRADTKLPTILQSHLISESRSRCFEVYQDTEMISLIDVEGKYRLMVVEWVTPVECGMRL